LRPEVHLDYRTSSLADGSFSECLSKAHSMNWRDYIESDPAICHGKPCLRVTRVVVVSVVLDCLAAGMTSDEIVREYPPVTKEGIKASLAFSSELSQDQTIAA
jgi:uncharacterized protein (DUF433 family)